MKNIKIRLLKIYYAPVCFLTDFIKGHQLKKHKIFIGTLILTLTLSSCHVKKRQPTCHMVINSNLKSEASIQNKSK